MKCPASLLCTVALLASIAAAYADVDCSHNFECLDDYSPVCGSDGTTYSNQCTLESAACKNPTLQLTKVHDGTCNSPRQPQAQEKACTKIYLAVCGSDGKTYNNQCLLENAASVTPGLQLAHSGEC